MELEFIYEPLKYQLLTIGRLKNNDIYCLRCLEFLSVAPKQPVMLVILLERLLNLILTCSKWANDGLFASATRLRLVCSADIIAHPKSRDREIEDLSCG